jgi:hypothetical protein
LKTKSLSGYIKLKKGTIARLPAHHQNSVEWIDLAISCTIDADESELFIDKGKMMLGATEVVRKETKKCCQSFKSVEWFSVAIRGRSSLSATSDGPEAVNLALALQHNCTRVHRRRQIFDLRVFYMLRWLCALIAAMLSGLEREPRGKKASSLTGTAALI